MTSSRAVDSGGSLGSRTLLDKIDKLRELGIAGQVPLPQMVVVGDQSAGKSSVLESLTGFHLPRSVSLCTRHATEIICRREDSQSVTVSIVPHSPDPKKLERAQTFRRTLETLQDDGFESIFEEAAEIMGIDLGKDKIKAGSAFSKDVLRVEISGPNEQHLTVIDVPGMFENETPGLTTTSDIELVKTMVEGYIRESRTIILAVVPCNGDIANQKILRYAADADPEGKRTLGVLTKPDLAVEEATKKVVVDLVNGKRRDLALGYCVVKNRGADDSSTDMEERHQKEKAFFAQHPWSALPDDRLGIPALRARIQGLLMSRTKSEIPKVKEEIAARLKAKKQLLEAMGASHSTPEEQRALLGKVASRFVQLKGYALDAYYTRDTVFQEQPDLKLITRMRELNEVFSKTLYGAGHTRIFVGATSPLKAHPVNGNGRTLEPGSESMSASEDGESEGGSIRDEFYYVDCTFAIPNDDQGELETVLADPYDCTSPLEDDILQHIEDEYLASRGYELGTFGAEVVSGIFKEQAKKWRPLTRAHVSNAILVVHHFIKSILEVACPEETIRSSLWIFLSDELLQRYQAAMEHTELLLGVEFQGRAMTYNPAFEKALARTKTERVKNMHTEEKKFFCWGKQNYVLSDTAVVDKLTSLFNKHIGGNDPIKKTRQDIHDVLHEYYKIARDRFVDVVCQQVVDHCLLLGPRSPLSVLSDQLVLQMKPAELEEVAGEDVTSRDRREALTREIDGLNKALKILRF
ncbi:P-loop containing nucleoside triphosphate hydrolase protein [Emericellopsis atlantica]|uniref:P-loop containing nucleoside triphosphate hydrolase protein n=1 Tax=Emericellopsis atlantica TaxID=2614577 RepID=A0A9P8CNE2_9HYPO|nr:P-loop containing nucleoside triphosphate hydrolase protein [Emericellopsis atlantica]KAG9251626.1 P-loop containing nucleoside triphosphate hydrolase protein [Emericellopsis atlantica]